MKNIDLVIIGGGAAGMAAAVSAHNRGIKDILIIERNSYVGGVLSQCIHNGFGLHRFNEDMTGVEFARRYRLMVEELDIPVLLNSFVIDMNNERVITVVNPDEGLIKIQAKAIVLAMGCRERTRNNLLIPGVRGAGIITAGTAQKYVNINGYLPGKSVVILGSGDIGLIMARQFIMEGVEVKAVVEIMPYSSGLPRNMKQCIEDFDIPVYFSSTVTEIRGKERVDSVLVAQVDENRKPIKSTEFEIPCDTLMISAGLIPENELSEQAGIEIAAGTKGAVVTEDYQTSVDGIFACGNVLHVHDLVDFVSQEAEAAGVCAADYILNGGSADDDKDHIKVINGSGASGIVPQIIRKSFLKEGSSLTLMFRPKAKYNDVMILAHSDGREIARQKGFALTPGEMISLTIPADSLCIAGDTLDISIKEAADE